VVEAVSVPFFRHDLGEPELAAIREVLLGPILTTGETVVRFERQFAQYLARPHAIGVTSCTGALHIALAALGVGPGDEVITTPMTFIATATAIIQAGATPVFVDVEPDTGNMDAELVEASITPRTRAIVPVHLYGQMCDMRRLREIADRHGLHIVEDAAHCVEGRRDGIRPGELSEAACFSFYATKAITSGEGGAIVVDDEELDGTLRLLRLHGMSKNAADRHREGYQHWDMPTFGWKYNMDNIQAALLLPQLDRLEHNWHKRAALADVYRSRLNRIEGLALPRSLPGVQHAEHLFTILVDPGRRDRVISSLQRQGIGVMVNYRAIHLLTYFREALGYEPGDFPIAERFGDSTISLPLYPTMPEDDVQQVVRSVEKALGET
jgi:dTDP-4-amino-4,6-dideoxygalactose transaminase